jgi:hypothetical protein
MKKMDAINKAISSTGTKEPQDWIELREEDLVVFAQAKVIARSRDFYSRSEVAVTPTGSILVLTRSSLYSTPSTQLGRFDSLEEYCDCYDPDGHDYDGLLAAIEAARAEGDWSIWV